MRLSSKHLSVVGVLLFLLILAKIDVPWTFRQIVGVRPAYILLCFATVAAEVLIRSVRWRLLAGQFLKKEYGLSESVQTLLMGVAFGAVTPGRVGDVVKAFDLRDRGVELKRALSVEIIDRLVDLLYLFLSALVGYLFLMIVVVGFDYSPLLLVLVAVLLVSFALVLFSLSTFSRIFRVAHNFLVPARFKNRSEEIFKVFQETKLILRSPTLSVQVFLLTAGWWTVMAMRSYVLALGLGLELSPLVFLFAMPVVSAIEIIPVSLLGIGTREAGFILVFSLLGVPAETMVAVSLMMLVLSMLPQVFAGFLIAYKKGVSLNLFTNGENS